MDDPEKPGNPPPPESPTEPATLEQARKFLEDDEVRLQSRERKIEFLKTKGLQESQIVGLLGPSTPEPVAQAEETPRQHEPPEPVNPAAEATESRPDADRPPIITYPEFLTTAAKPPPLLTAAGFLRTMGAFAGLSSLIYGTGNLVVAPMADALTDARADWHGAVSRNLGSLVDKLEAVVGQGAPAAPAAGQQVRAPGEREHHADVAEDLSRDLGEETALQLSPALVSSPARTQPAATAPRSCVAQARRITRWADLLGGAAHLTAPDFGVYTMQNEVDELKDLVEKYTKESASASGINEPDDEIKRVKYIIRRIKGVLLTTKSFPASTR